MTPRRLSTRHALKTQSARHLPYAPNLLYQRLTQMTESLEDPVLKSIRVELYFHVLAARRWKNRRWVRDQLYPVWTRYREARARQLLPQLGTGASQEAILVVAENETAAGLGTLMPIVLDPGVKRMTVAVTDRVALALRGRFPNTPGRSWVRMPGAGELPDERPMLRERLARLLAASRSCGLGDDLKSMGNTVKTLIEKASVLHRGLLSYLRSCPQTRTIILHNDFMPATYLASSIAQQLSVREITLQHGMPVLEYVPIKTGRYFIWGHWAHEWFLDHGAPAEALSVVGCPRMDRLFRADRHQLPSGPPRLVILSQTHSQVFEKDQHEEVVRMIGVAIENLDPAWEVHVKLHPLERRVLYRRLWSTAVLQRARFRARGEDLHDVLAEATVLVGARSTSMIEGMIVGRPVLAVTPDGQSPAGYGAGVSGTVVETGEALSEAAMRLESDRTFRAKVLRAQDAHLESLFVHRGHATNAVLQHLR